MNLSEKHKKLVPPISVGLAVIIYVVFFGRTVWDTAWSHALEWGIQPSIFIGLLLITSPFFWYSWWLIVRSLKRRDREALSGAVIMNRIAWGVPYLYVLVYGQNYPWWVPTGIFAWAIVSAILFAHKIRLERKKQAELVVRATKKKPANQ